MEMAGLDAILETTAAERPATGFVFTEGPLWHPDDYYYFADVRSSVFYRLRFGQQPETVRTGTGEGNGTTFDLQGRPVICEGGNGGLPAGPTTRIAKSSWIAIRASGSIVPMTSSANRMEASGLPIRGCACRLPIRNYRIPGSTPSNPMARAVSSRSSNIRTA